MKFKRKEEAEKRLEEFAKQWADSEIPQCFAVTIEAEKYIDELTSNNEYDQKLNGTTTHYLRGYYHIRKCQLVIEKGRI